MNRVTSVDGEDLTMILCSTCGAENAQGATVCRKCNSPIELAEAGRTGETRGLAPTKVTPKAAAAPVSCPACGASNVPTYLFCQKCGARLQQPSAGAEPVPEPEHKSDGHVAGTAESAGVPATVSVGAAAKLVLIMELGDQGDEYLVGDGVVIGRRTGDITFPHDDYMSGRHAKIEKQGSRYILSDEGSRNGIFIKIDKEVEIRSGDQILIGKQLFRFEK